MSMRSYLFTSRKPVPGGQSYTFTVRFQDEYAVFAILGRVVKMNADHFRELYKKIERVYN